MLTTMFATLFKVGNLHSFDSLLMSPSFCRINDVKLNEVLIFPQVLLLFFMFVMAFSSTFYLLLDEETVRFFEVSCLYSADVNVGMLVRMMTDI